MTVSMHYSTERQSREQLIQEIGLGKIIKSCHQDNGHKNGPEIHEISDTGIITIYNERTGKLVTRIIARPGQIRRYYPNGNAPRYLIDIAIKHKNLGYNCR